MVFFKVTNLLPVLLLKKKNSEEKQTGLSGSKGQSPERAFTQTLLHT